MMTKGPCTNGDSSLLNPPVIKEKSDMGTGFPIHGGGKGIKRYKFHRCESKKKRRINPSPRKAKKKRRNDNSISRYSTHSAFGREEQKA